MFSGPTTDTRFRETGQERGLGTSEPDESKERNSLFDISYRARSEKLLPQNVNGKTSKHTAVSQRKKGGPNFVQTTINARKCTLVEGGEKLLEQPRTVNEGFLK